MTGHEEQKKFQPVSDGELAEQLLAFYTPSRCADSDENETHCSDNGVWGGHLMVKLYFHPFCHMARNSTQRPTLSAWMT